jgi:hypothetical protein
VRAFRSAVLRCPVSDLFFKPYGMVGAGLLLMVEKTMMMISDATQRNA